jgi:competence protein ComEA
MNISASQRHSPRRSPRLLRNQRPRRLDVVRWRPGPSKPRRHLLVGAAQQMSIEIDAQPVVFGPDADPRPALAGWPWPHRVRGLLIAMVSVAGLGIHLVGGHTRSGPQRAYRLAPVLVVDPNTAPASVLEALPHLGPALVKRIVEQRSIRPFASMSDMRQRVRGMGPATLAQLTAHLKIGSNDEPLAQSRASRGLLVPGEQRIAQGPRPPASR